ncbi:bifunctional tRNA (5-methylaminomethyl-2-thiouridine)(34)-methyltransferase MnmD/FAD-dependent 5-carboxymethylaminomethyl-2-thiouridine(34) oxidoreductase MnmC [Halomonas sp. 18H]|uniref:bifunctional tRNA (5-methylaminomethyl-2-thiouridine)(34)-methyltransferase MnmD/FAD-dependent 5-carboxymethylaminomethyl-2-thiouridine(34) oxidoreductase MnmC n=1 Tax=Halomonas almeriensis TaxID=308163 RepID=UPI0022328913|nr:MULTISPECIES: bifunctional tRNA (5-methylaminomethyl-2-thiouridine)(34)-methyltransferase MnmD/FAD-dependent 5-carboxymethylaminomethyl-2-thiouridine(34) oxidoreductase MnmC [Halomonas]MCW4149658.1 bifunctional tRNA (5-methylaminomethyl-2-thiouridine)(34)-methyltransferase MnmD/FAD-dependent 5-carboxymethylaminomethyl-2-thiouridine(34) oxidoreductase MnmC [Halomonas sp. 18H]MDN3553397.1 bifunctional tRNA (5-methylaminomethyl-2-thiouridine)(34)-methyltransferase MnmD/FAD-dependent 5-carboxymeth
MPAAPDALPPLAGLTPASLDWQADETGSASPHSREFGDVYFSRHDGRAETRHVFLDANQLPRRLAAWRLDRPFVIGETGFGTGLNMLCAWACFDEHAPPEARLHLISTELYPLTRDDLSRALAAWPDLAERAACLLAQWPAAVSGVHRLWLDARVTLDLHFGDATERLRHLDGRVDAWFLDGFAPARNPGMWQASLFEAMAARSRPGATLATFTCAGVVKRGLAAAGFRWRKVSGFGRKRDMLVGEIAEPPADRRRRSTPWFLPSSPGPRRHISVIGSGLAGASAAAALARRGVQVTLIDREAPGAGASGNTQGLLYVKLAAETNDQSRCYLAGLLHSRRWLESLDPHHRLWQPSGVLQLASSPREQARQARFADNHPLPSDVVERIDAVAASQLAGVPLNHGGLHYPLGGWVRPQALCRRLAETPGVTFRRAHVQSLQASSTSWRLALTTDKGTEHLETDQVVIATASLANRFTQTERLPLQPVRGQVSALPLPDHMPAPHMAICGGGYVAPPHNGELTFGATFQPNQNDDTLCEADHQANLAELARLLPGYPERLEAAGVSLDPATMRGRAAVRAASPDKTPYAGPVPDATRWREDYARLAKDATRVPDTPGQYHQGLWISAAHGSRGLASAPLCAEVIASRICDEPMPLEATLINHLHPGRRLIRDLIQGK